MTFGFIFTILSTIRPKSVRYFNEILMEAILKQEVINSIPKPFITEVMRAVDWAYQEAHNASANNPLLDKSEQEWIAPYYRRAILDKRLRDVAAAQGLRARVANNASGNYQFTEVSVNRFLLTCSHHTGEEWRMLRKSEYRNQNAALNSLLAQTEFGFEAFQVVDDGRPFNAVILHKHDLKDPSKAGYVKLAIPSVDNTRMVARFNFYELVEAYPRVAVTNDDDALVVKWKSKVHELEG